MEMDVSRFSDVYDVRILREDDIPEIYQLCSKNELYYRYCPPFVSTDSLRDDMQALPPGREKKDKYYVGYYEQGKLNDVMDFINGFPDSRTAFIGFFMTAKERQNRNLGTKIISDLCAYLKESCFQEVRLGWVKGNPQAENFWHKNHFVETGVTYDTDGYTVIVAHRILK